MKQKQTNRARAVEIAVREFLLLQGIRTGRIHMECNICGKSLEQGMDLMSVDLDDAVELQWALDMFLLVHADVDHAETYAKAEAEAVAAAWADDDEGAGHV